MSTFDRSSPHPLSLIGCRTFAKLVRTYGVDPGYRGLASRLAATCAVGIPFRRLDNVRSFRKVGRIELPKSPVFIIGHWRSGTTHLHNLFTCDPQFAYVKAFHCVAAQSFLGARSLVYRSLAKRMPSERPMDAVRFGLEEAQEEEFAMSRISEMSFLHAYYFPRKLEQIFRNWVLFDDITEKQRDRWKRTYGWFLRRVIADQGPKPLCLKSPPHAARIPTLLEMFPDAKFIHIYRNPYVVQQSNNNLWRKFLDAFALHNVEWNTIEDQNFGVYSRLHERLYNDIDRIPSGQFAEVRFEDVEQNPVGEVARLYSELALPGFETAKPHLEEYIAAQQSYRKNEYTFDAETVNRIDHEWRMVLDRWNYERPNVYERSS